MSFRDTGHRIKDVQVNTTSPGPSSHPERSMTGSSLTQPGTQSPEMQAAMRAAGRYGARMPEDAPKEEKLQFAYRQLPQLEQQMSFLRQQAQEAFDSFREASGIPTDHTREPSDHTREPSDHIVRSVLSNSETAEALRGLYGVFEERRRLYLNDETDAGKAEVAKANTMRQLAGRLGMGLQMAFHNNQSIEQALVEHKDWISDLKKIHQYASEKSGEDDSPKLLQIFKDARQEVDNLAKSPDESASQKGR